MNTFNKGVFFLWLYLMIGVKLTNGENSTALHSSPDQLESVFAFDRLVGDALRFIPSPSPQARRYLESYGWLVTDARLYGGDTGHMYFIGHPLHVFTLIKRLVLFYPSIRHIFNRSRILTDGRKCVDNSTYCDHWKSQGRCARDREFMMSHCPKLCGMCAPLESIKLVREAENRTVLPTSWDLTAASEAIAILQKIYALPIPDLTKGKIYDIYSSVEMNEWDCVRIARASARQERLSSAWVWYHHIRTVTTNPEMAAYASDLIENIAILHDQTWKDNDEYFPRKLSEFPLQKQRPSNFFKLCRGEYIKDSGLKCELTSKGNPFLLIQPVKQETVLEDPEMYLYHDIISEAEIETLKVLSGGNLIKDPGAKRISQMAFLADERHPMLESLARRASMLSGLLSHEGTDETKAAEPVKIRKYVPGGHLVPHADVYYKHHMDPQKFRNFTHGDRMATVMFYLNEGFAGGRTAFYNLNISLTPAKGSAVFWYNLKKNGDYDRRMGHGGCPVVLGTKWLALKWIRESFNFQTRPCSLVQDE